MTKTPSILELPLPLVGISDQVGDWLRQAGLPVTRLGQESILKSAFRRKRPSLQTDTAPSRCLLFDSRDVWSRAVVKTHRKQSLCMLDIAKVFAKAGEVHAPEFSADDIANSSRFAFLEQLKTDLEAAGGVWARLADLPFPYQGVGCLDGELPSAFLQVETQRLDTNSRTLPGGIAFDDLRGGSGGAGGTRSRNRSAIAGLAFVVADRHVGVFRVVERAGPVARQVVAVRDALSNPLFAVARRRYCPVLEIWRGRHVAGIPLRSESIAVRKEGLVFQQQPTRHPAGFTAGWPDRNTAGPSPRLSA